MDPFDGGEKELDPALRSAMADVERRFDENLAPFALRCEKRKGRSVAVLPNLAMEGYRFELIYVDGDHRARNVYNDAALSWPLLVTGGIIIFDDYQWDQERPSEDRPQLGIDSFLEAMKGHYRDVHRGYQIIVEKL